MKLLTHNMLTSKILKNVVNGYPLRINAVKTEIKKADFQPDFIARMIQKIDYKALFQAAETLGYSEGLPKVEFLSDQDLNENILKKLHEILLEVEVIEGDLECPETGRKFPISNGIPNMLVNDEEI
ncbi:multifunctional methyltransferase subunit TRM112 [Brachionus plicatilis]|uniref:Multifunctional methyltransferase subunit TRM112-like protein n=1 Tax=Brachionus plicatilis TaxID=10195 RepID=A0A3M7SPX2_BRAPC|nr:multifunctional methyltransferase subunit TRM112 [Brachionus plicatilis]